jgi:hypothetical protein
MRRALVDAMRRDEEPGQALVDLDALGDVEQPRAFDAAVRSSMAPSSSRHHQRVAAPSNRDTSSPIVPGCRGASVRAR